MTDDQKETELEFQLRLLYSRVKAPAPWRAVPTGHWTVVDANGHTVCTRVMSEEIARMIALLPDICDPALRRKSGRFTDPVSVRDIT